MATILGTLEREAYDNALAYNRLVCAKEEEVLLVQEICAYISYFKQNVLSTLMSWCLDVSRLSGGSEVEMVHGAPPRPKKAESLTRAATYGTKYNPAWLNEYPFVSCGQRDQVYSFYYKVWQKDVSCWHQGITDVKNSSGHSSRVKSLQSNKELIAMGYIPVGSAIDSQVSHIGVYEVHILYIQKWKWQLSWHVITFILLWWIICHPFSKTYFQI